MKKILTFSIIIILTNLPILVLANAKGKVTKEVYEEIIEQLIKRGGKEVVEQSSRKVAAETLERLTKTYGNNVLKIVDDAGFELLEAVPKYGDDIIKISMKTSPEGRRVFAKNIPELFPLAKRIGPEAIELEAKSPGLSKQIFNVFGDDAGKAIAKNVPLEDIPRLLKYAEKADLPATKKLLLEKYNKEGKMLFERVPPKLILYSGLSASMLYGTHQATAPIRAVANAINENPDVAQRAVSLFGLCAATLILIVIILLLWRFDLMPWHRKQKKKLNY